MGFLAPWFLAGIAAVSLPLYLHLLRRSQHTPRPFSSLMFFERRLETTSKQRRLRYLALLAARMALLALLALAFASPFVNRTEGALRKRKLTVLAIDRSFSMRAAEGGGQTRLDEAKRQAHSVVRGLPSGSLAQVVAFDNRVENMTTPDANSGTLDGAIDTIQASDLDSSLGELVRGLRALAQSKDTALDVHLFSDMQQTSMPHDFHDLALGDMAELHTHRAGQTLANWTVESVTTAPHVYDVKRTRLAATITGFDTRERVERAELILDGQTLDTKQVTVPANGLGEVEFRGFNVPYGQHRGEVRITPQDKLGADDRYLFSVERADARPVLFLHARGRERQSFYYRAALESAADTGLTVETAPIERVADKDLSRYAFIVVHDAGNIDKAAEQKICAYVMGGGAALVAIGPDTIRAGRVPLSKLTVKDAKETQGVGFVDGQHAATSGSGRFENVQFYETARWQPLATDHILAKLADGSPLLVEEPMGEGRVLQFAATLDSASSDFPLHAAYLPFVAQTGRYLAGGEDANASYVAGSAIALRRARTTQAATDVTGPDGKHELSLAQSKGNSSFTVDREGFYEVARADGRRQLIAAHADRRESDLRAIPDETLDLWRNTGSTTAADHGGRSAQASNVESRPWSFWRYVLMLAVIAAVIESAIARKFMQEGQRTV